MILKSRARKKTILLPFRKHTFFIHLLGGYHQQMVALKIYEYIKHLSKLVCTLFEHLGSSRSHDNFIRCLLCPLQFSSRISSSNHLLSMSNSKSNNKTIINGLRSCSTSSDNFKGGNK